MLKMAYLFDKFRQNNKLKLCRMYKKFLIAAVFIFVAMALLPTFVKSNFACAGAENEIEIATVEDFINMPDNTTANFKLVADLDFSTASTNYKPKNFCGTLNGNGHSISNLNIVSENSAGLFLCVSNASLCNLTINNFQIYSGNNAGALAVCINSSVLNNVKINLSTCYITGASSAGKLATNISDCNFIDVVVIGGIVNGVETSELAFSITNTTLKTTKYEEVDPLPETPDNKDDENTTPPNVDDNEPDESSKTETDNNNSSEVEPPTKEPDDNSGSLGADESLPTLPSVKDEPTLPSVPDVDKPAQPEIKNTVVANANNAQIVVNHIDAVKIIVVCLLTALAVGLGFCEPLIKKCLKKHSHKNK